MRKTLASIVIIAFVGLLSVSVLAFFNGSIMSRDYMQGRPTAYPYFVAY